MAYWLSDYDAKLIRKAQRFDAYYSGMDLDVIPKDLPGCLKLKQLKATTRLRCAEEAIRDLLEDGRVAKVGLWPFLNQNLKVLIQKWPVILFYNIVIYFISLNLF